MTKSNYEIKRGHGEHDSGKRQKIIDDLIRVRLVLAGHLRACGYAEVRTAAVRLVSYYGTGAIGPIPTLTRGTIDAHFGVPVTTTVGAAAELMQAAAMAILQDELRLLFGAGADAVSGHAMGEAFSGAAFAGSVLSSAFPAHASGWAACP